MTVSRTNWKLFLFTALAIFCQSIIYTKATTPTPTTTTTTTTKPKAKSPSQLLETTINVLTNKDYLLTAVSGPDAFMAATNTSEEAVNKYPDRPHISEWNFFDHYSYQRIINDLTNPTISLNVEVRLVCFDKDGARKFSIREEDLAAYITTVTDNRLKGLYSVTPITHYQNSINPFSGDNSGVLTAQTSNESLDLSSVDQSSSSASHSELLTNIHNGATYSNFDSSGGATFQNIPLLTSKLPLSQRLNINVSKVPQSTCKQYANAIQDSITEQAHHLLSLHEAQSTSSYLHITTPFDHFYEVPEQTIAHILTQDQNKVSKPYVLYIANPSIPTVPLSMNPASSDSKTHISGNRTVKYAFTNRDKSAVFRALNPSTASSMPPTCPHQIVLASADTLSIEIPSSKSGTGSGTATATATATGTSKVIHKKHPWASNSIFEKEIQEQLTSGSQLEYPRWGLLDISAGPVAIGPTSSGEGIITETTLPRLSVLFQRHANDSKTTKLTPSTGANPTPNRAIRKPNIDPRYQSMSATEKIELIRDDLDSKHHEFVAELSSFVNKFIHHVVSPPIWSFPRKYAQIVLINVFVIQDYIEDLQMIDGKRAESKNIQQFRLLAKKLQSIAPQGQRIVIDLHMIKMEECELCLTGFMNAMRSTTIDLGLGAFSSASASKSATLDQFKQKQQATTTVSGAKTVSYIDSAQLGTWMREFRDGFWDLRVKHNRGKGGSAGYIKPTYRASNTPSIRITSQGSGIINENGRWNPGDSHLQLQTAEILPSNIRTLDTFVFDLNTKDGLLFDKQNQAAALPISLEQMQRGSSAISTILAIQTAVKSDIEIDFQCGGNNMTLDYSDATSAIFSTLLSEIYGVTPSHIVVNSARLETNTDFSPFQHSLQTNLHTTRKLTTNTLAAEFSFLFSATQTPYGACGTYATDGFVNTSIGNGVDSLISKVGLHFGIKDAIQRNTVLTEYISSLYSILGIQERLSKFRFMIQETAGEELFSEFRHRSAILNAKFAKIRDLLATTKYAEGIFYARSARHDAHAIERISKQIMKKFRPTLSCSTKPKEIIDDDEEDGEEESSIGSAISTLGSLFSTEEIVKPSDNDEKLNTKIIDSLNSSSSLARQRSAVRTQYDTNKAGEKSGKDKEKYEIEARYKDNRLINRLEQATVIKTTDINTSTKAGKRNFIMQLLSTVAEIIFIVVLVFCIALFLFTDVFSCCKRKNTNGGGTGSGNGNGMMNLNGPRGYSNTYVPQQTSRGWFNVFGNKKKSRD